MQIDGKVALFRVQGLVAATPATPRPAGCRMVIEAPGWPPRDLSASVPESLRPKKLPKFIQEAARKLLSHVEESGLLPVLNFHADGRKVRSERRDGIGMLLVALVLHMDLATRRVGFPTENGFFNYTIDHLATWAGLGERRAARIVATLKDAGYLAVSQIRERLKDGSYRSFSAIKIVSATLFEALGLRGWLNKERAKARERLGKKQKAYEKACAKRGTTMMNRLTAKIAGMAQTEQVRNANKKEAPPQAASEYLGKRANDPISKYLDQLNPEAKATIFKLASDIKMEHRDWSRDKIYEEAKKLLPGIY